MNLYKKVLKTYPGLEMNEQWHTNGNDVDIEDMSKNHIKNTINMLHTKSSYCIRQFKYDKERTLKLHGRTERVEELEEVIILFEEKIKEFKEFL